MQPRRTLDQTVRISFAIGILYDSVSNAAKAEMSAGYVVSSACFKRRETHFSKLIVFEVGFQMVVV